ncbi:uncharacterized protein SPPG_06058 [Spizellomyces punctatus DAOM BR117]|uniref:DUF6603 domain-containing protein n=1 Tax=Spizellomyces punctatus (strain DAOM BR117) TaxID=645134 RepID=A0A0L0HBV0_SPIPD|nr:uncharacterized protein SPPG_06058 [Spizellomyces punctatus DAOM BR117]KNC98349.1 hypothetical protein SPPG_06058 [Spizellomyces punctatus DAOM BR117]|eukprot:XP_016606389.1 hypothetical protein SPPG_06058 [Spizellomyces punctatus DAOM BR117]
MDNTRVDVFHVNIGTGDSTIYLLVDTTTTTWVISGTVKAAVLADGGQSPNAYQVIKNAIKDIEQKYLPYAADSTALLKFDAVVLTHWDDDHYRGLFDLLLDGLSSTAPQCTRLKYDDKGAPTSTFYAPYAADDDLEKGGVRLVGGEVDPKTHELSLIAAKAKVERVVKVRTLERNSFRADVFLGTELFSDRSLSTTSPKDIKSPKELIGAHNKDYGPIVAPGLYCVAGNEQCLGPAMFTVVDKPDSSKRNKYSLFLLVIWPTNPVRVAHYLAGDADYSMEDKVCRWINRDGPVEVPNLKASHHGSTYSTPTQVITGLKPSNIIISAYTEYGHPGWPLLCYLDAYRAKNNPPTFNVYATCYPYYLVEAFDTVKWPFAYTDRSGSLDPFTENDPINVKFQDALKALDGNALKTAFETERLAKPKATIGDMKAWLYEKTAGFWATLSTVGKEYHPFVGSTTMLYIKLQLLYNGSTVVGVENQPPFPAMFRRKIKTTKLYPPPRRVQPPRAAARASINAAAPIASATATDVIGKVTKKRRRSLSELRAKMEVPATVRTGPTPSAVENLVTLAAADVVANDNVTFILSSYVDPVPGMQSALASLPQALDVLIGSLSFGYLTLTGPMVTALPGTALDPNEDELSVWLRWCGLDGTYVSTDSTGGVIFTCGLRLPGQPANGEITYFTSNSAGEGIDSELVMLHLRMQPTTAVLACSMQDIARFLNLEKINMLRLADDLTFQINVDPKSRNCLWFVPQSNYLTVIRLEASATAETINKINGAIGTIFSGAVSVTGAKVVARKTMTSCPYSDGIVVESVPELILSMTLKAKDFEMDAFLDYNPDVTILTLQWRDGIALSQILQWLASTCSSGTIDVDKWIPNDHGSLRLLRAHIAIDNNLKPSEFTIDFELILKFGGNTEREKPVFLLSYTWPKNSFSGSLWMVPDQPFVELLQKLPDYEDYRLLTPSPLGPGESYSSSICLANLNPNAKGAVTKPPGLPTDVILATLSIDPDSIAFSGIILADEPSVATDNGGKNWTPISLDEVDLQARYDWRKKSLSLSLHADITLSPRPKEDKKDSSAGSTSMSVALSFNDGKWQLTGEAFDVNLGVLYSFFDDGQAVMSLLEHIRVPHLGLQYDYEKDTGSNFTFDGTLDIGGVRLTFTYAYQKDKTWSFKADLRKDDPRAVPTDLTAGKVLAGYFGNTDLLPDLVNNIELDRDSFNLSLGCSKSTTSNSIVLYALLSPTKDFHLSLIQIQNTDMTAPPKRMVHCVLGIPTPHSVPLVPSFSMPVDEIEYLWIQPSENSMGLTADDVCVINTAVPDPYSYLKYKLTSVSPKKTDVVLLPGSHVLLTESNSGVVLDYVFGKQTGSAKANTLRSGRTPDGDTEDAGATKSPLHKSDGILSVENIGLQYKNKKLYVLLDASVHIGPIEMALLGFGIGVNLSALTDFSNPDLDITLSGLGVEYMQPPVTIAGIFQKTSSPDVEQYNGGVVIAIAPYSFLAFGSYGKAHDATHPSTATFKTFFVFAKLNGPLIELEFAEITGISLGFGYNSNLKYPSVDQVMSFPLIGNNVPMPGNDPMVLLESLNSTPGGWISPQEKSLWIAAGLEVTAFQVLDVQALVVLEFNPYVSLGVFAKAICSVPAKTPRQNCFVYAELEISCRVELHAGFMSVEAELSPNSFVLHPSCHLRGGFALYYWFSPSLQAGDFVFTIGGYHPAFVRPSYYPNPKRLGISWQLDRNLSVTGEAYFAVTPKMCMGGGRLAAVLSCGPLSAHFEEHADFLINWAPFHFKGSIGISVGVAFTLDLWICTIHIRVDIGAMLELEGPEFGGVVHVDFWVFGFDIHFGPRPGRPPALKLEEFWQLLLQQDTNTPKSLRAGDPNLNLTDDKTADHRLTVESGYEPNHKKDMVTEGGAQWSVRAGILRFRIESKFLVSAVTYRQDQANPVQVGRNVFAKPMQLQSPLSSVLDVSVTGPTSEVVSGFQFSPIWKQVPTGNWGKYSPNEDPSSGDRIDTLLDHSDHTETTMEALIGITVSAPPPKLSDPDKPFPAFDAASAMSYDVYNGAHPKLPPTTQSQPSWLPQPPLLTPGDAQVVSPEQFDKVYTIWSSDDKIPSRKSLIDAWHDTTGWVTTLSPEKPVVMFNEFYDIYMAAPLLMAA